jgi:hypothetical protein
LIAAARPRVSCRTTSSPAASAMATEASVLPPYHQLSADDILRSPYVLIGTVDQTVEDLRARRERWGISYYVISEPHLDAFAPVVARLAGR